MYVNLVKHYIDEGYLFKDDPFFYDVILELILDQLQPQVPSLVLGAPVGDQLEARCPGVQLLPPVVHGGAGHHNQVFSLLPDSLSIKVGEEGDRLDRVIGI